MLNLLNKSVKSINSGLTTIVSGITSENCYKTEIDFCKFDTIHLNLLSIPSNNNSNLNENFINNPDFYYKEHNVLIIIYSKIYLNIYLLTEDIELKIIFNTKLGYNINSADSLYIPFNTTYKMELPIVGLISNYNSDMLNMSLGNISNKYTNTTSSGSGNSNTNNNINNITTHKNECYFKLFSIKTKRVVHNLRFKKKIVSVISKFNYFALSFVDGSIKLFENDKMANFLSINTNEARCTHGSFSLSGNVYNSSGNTPSKISSNSVLNSSSLNLNNSINHINQNLKYPISGCTNNIYPIFDISDNYLLYYVTNNSSLGINGVNLNLNNTFSNTSTIQSNYSSENSVKIESNTNNNGNPSFKITQTTVNIDKTNNNLNNSNYNSEKVIKKFNKIKTTLSNSHINKNDSTSNLIGNNNNFNNLINTFSPQKSTSNTNNYNNSLESFASEAYKNISKLKDWSVSQVKDLSNLRNASNFKNNLDLKSNDVNVPQSGKKNQCSLILVRLDEFKNSETNLTNNFNSSNETSKLTDNVSRPGIRIQVPFFDDGISLVKFFNQGKYFLVANKNSQMFYIYELYPQSNLKYTSEADSGCVSQNNTAINNNFKIIYSLYRGITSAVINSVDLSPCKNFAVIGSNKGTFHLFSLPKRDNQIFENSSNFDYQNFDEINQKVICGKDFEKLKFNNFLYNYTYKTTCKLVNFTKIDVDVNFTQEMKDNLLKNKFNKISKGLVLLTFSEHDACVHLYYLNKNFINANVSTGLKSLSTGTNSHHAKPTYLLKKLELSNFPIIDDKEEIEKNYNDILKKNTLLLKNTNSHVMVSGSIPHTKPHLKDYIELECTDKNFPNLHNNPLFSFNIMKSLTRVNSNMNVNSGNNKVNTSTSSNKKPNNNLVQNSNNKHYSNNELIIEENNEYELSPTTSINFQKQETPRNSYMSKKEKSQKRKQSINKIENVISIHLPSLVMLKKNTNSMVLNTGTGPTGRSGRSRSGSLNMKMNPGNNLINIAQNLNSSMINFTNDIQIHEKLICVDIDYTPKFFNTEKRIIPKSDFISNDTYFHPKLIVYPGRNVINSNKNKKIINRINTSISDNSSSKDNSVSLTGIGEENLQNSQNNHSFYKNKEILLETQIKNAIESNIVDSINKNNNNMIVRVVGDFKIDDNYYKSK